MTDTQKTAAESGEPTSPDQEPTDYVADQTFEEMGLSAPLLKALAEKGYKTPTPVQARAFGPAAAGRDLIVRSKTGTGKTAAFGLPVLERIDVDAPHVQAIILCPTRELALQRSEEHTSELQSRENLVCRLLLEKK